MNVPDASVWAAVVVAIGGVSTQIVQNMKHSEQLKEVKIELNSRLTELVEAVRVSSFAKGRAEGMAEERTKQIVSSQGIQGEQGIQGIQGKQGLQGKSEVK